MTGTLNLWKTTLPARNVTDGLTITRWVEPLGSPVHLPIPSSLFTTVIRTSPPRVEATWRQYTEGWVWKKGICNEKHACSASSPIPFLMKMHLQRFFVNLACKCLNAKWIFFGPFFVCIFFTFLHIPTKIPVLNKCRAPHHEGHGSWEHFKNRWHFWW